MSALLRAGMNNGCRIGGQRFSYLALGYPGGSIGENELPYLFLGAALAEDAPECDEALWLSCRNSCAVMGSLCFQATLHISIQVSL